ncbi:hypothetical protein ATERTT37_007119 [Aspergillus terreus]
MEVPGVDDTMEMASPYQGHVDDFDIDLDVMEDQISTTDKDMMGDDDYQDSSHDMGLEPEGANDEDMMDDFAEPTMTDPDEHYPDTNDNVEMQYSAEKSYEAEMLEDDYDEDIDAPVPEFHEDAPSHEYHSTDKAPEHPIAEEPSTADHDIENSDLEYHPEAQAELVRDEDGEKKDESDPPHDGDKSHSVAQESESHLHEAENKADNTAEASHDTNKAEQSDSKAVPFEEQSDNFAIANQPEHKEDAQGIEVTVAEGQGSDAQQVEGHSQTKEEEIQPTQQHEEAADTTEHDSALYPVKVYYQDNEISLFPPQEGDSSETFFLEDEGLAYEPLGKLFASCREVLRDHVGENEVLVMDVDSLNIQLTEDSMHISKVTLHQIVDLYLRLCHNDGVDEPEALYLTLSTRLTIAAEVSDLTLAASEGKGLSQIHSWDGYQEADAETGNAGGQTPRDPHDEAFPVGEDQQSTTGSGVEAQTETVQHEETADQDEKDHGLEQNVSLGRHTDSGLGIQDNGPPQARLNGNESQEPQETEEPEHEDESYDIRDGEGPEDPSYDSEEQHTESTATITQLPATELAEGQNPEEDDDVAGEDHIVPGADDETYDPDFVGDDYVDEYQRHDDERDDNDGLAENDGSREVYEAELNVEDSYEEVSGEDDHPHEHDAVDVTAEHNEDDAEETSRDDTEDFVAKDSETALDQTPPEFAELKPTSTRDSAEHPPNDGHDTRESPSRRPSEVGHETSHNENGPLTTESAAEDPHEELEFDEGELLDLGVPDEFDATNEESSDKPSGSASVKRQRDEEDEFELVESPSPDVKRSRSS